MKNHELNRDKYGFCTEQISDRSIFQQTDSSDSRLLVPGGPDSSSRAKFHLLGGAAPGQRSPSRSWSLWQGRNPCYALIRFALSLDISSLLPFALVVALVLVGLRVIPPGTKANASRSLFCLLSRDNMLAC